MRSSRFASQAAGQILWGYGAKIIQTTANTGGIQVTHDRVQILGLEWAGVQSAVARSSEEAIRLQGASATAPLSGVVVADCIIHDWGQSGIRGQFVMGWSSARPGFLLARNTIYNIANSAIGMSSSRYGRIVENDIANVTGGGATDAYGVYVDGGEAASLATNPRSSDIVIANNVVRDIPIWEAYDTHAGQRITFANNRWYNCKFGITVGPANNDNRVSTWAPLDCIVIGNVGDSGKSDGSAGAGITVAGAAGTVGASVEKAKGCVVSGNAVHGHGVEADDLTGAYLFRDTVGLLVTSNMAVEPSPIGFLLYHDNYDFQLLDNIVIDAWSTTSVIAGFVRFRSGYNKGTIANNRLVRDSKVAANVCTYGLRADSASQHVLRARLNEFGVASAFQALDAGTGQVIDDVSYYRLNRLFSSGAVTIGTTTTKVNLGAAITYTANGAQKTKAITADFWTLSGAAVTPSKVQKYLLCIDDTGAAVLIEGTQAATAAAVVFTRFPAITQTMVGVLQIATDGATTFTPGTTALNAAGVTATFTQGDPPELLSMVR